MGCVAPCNERKDQIGNHSLKNIAPKGATRRLAPRRARPAGRKSPKPRRGKSAARRPQETPSPEGARARPAGRKTPTPGPPPARHQERRFAPPEGGGRSQKSKQGANGPAGRPTPQAKGARANIPLTTAPTPTASRPMGGGPPPHFAGGTR